MNAWLVDATDFQLVAEPGEDEAEDTLDLAEMEDWARNVLDNRGFGPYCQELLLAYGLPRVIALYLARLDLPVSPVYPIPTGRIEGKKDLWVVVGDLPAIHFWGDWGDTRDYALESYCITAEEWAQCVLDGESLDECFPIPAAPTREHARMLLSRVRFIRDEIIPVVRGEVTS